MRDELFPFQRKAVGELRLKVAAALNGYRMTHTPQVVSFTAPTGSGKTIIMATLIEDIMFGTDQIVEQPEAIFVWLSDSPQLNAQSKDKIDVKADKIRFGQCVTIEEESFDMETLEEGHIYFLNTQKLGKKGKLSKAGDGRTWTIWETLENTAKQKADHLYFIIDEAHRGMQGTDAGRATTIMQKFLKGSPADKLSPMPVVIGMSATTARFNKLVAGITSTEHKVVVTANEVRSSGLLKDRIILTYPENPTADGMSVLEAAAEDWKDKCLHWYQYSYEQHYEQVNPILLIQVLNSAGKEATATDMGECISVIERRTGWQLHENEVVHTFGQTAAITANGLNIPHVEASEIAGDKRIRVVFFKENLSTGWDCPRAETMMSFRHAEDATNIAQLLGRMIRAPLQMRIKVDESLNDVHLYLPYFNRETAKKIVDELQNAEGGDIPTVIEEESLENREFKTWTARPGRWNNKPVQGQIPMNLFDFGNDPVTGEDLSKRVPGSNTVPQTPITVKQIHPQEEPTTVPSNVAQEQADDEPATPMAEAVQLKMNTGGIDREAIIKAINDLGLLTYEIRLVKTSTYLAALEKLVGLLTISGIDRQARARFEGDIVEMIHAYADKLKAEGEYEFFADQVTQLKLSAQIFDVFGESVDQYAEHDIYMSTDAELGYQQRKADAKLGNMGISNAYGRKYYDAENPHGFIIDVVLFAADDACVAKLNKYAEAEYHELCDKYRVAFAYGGNQQYLKLYNDIVADSDEVSKHPMRLPETIGAFEDKDGKEYDNHLYVDDETGKAKIKLNTWEDAVLSEEMRRPDFVCWLRNQSRAKWALCLPYEKDGKMAGFYPDFLIIRRDPVLGYIVDVLEPHGQQYADNLPKAKALAQYGKDEPRIARLQLIHMDKDITGKSRLKRLDLAKNSVRGLVSQVQTVDELDHVFDIKGEFSR